MTIMRGTLITNSGTDIFIVGPNSVQSNPPGGPGSVPSYTGPPSTGPHSIASASMMSPPVAGTTTGIPVSMALQESKNEFQEALRRQQLQHSANAMV